MKLNPILAFSLLGVVIASGTAWASGDHKGGHGADDMAIGKPGVAAKVDRTVNVEMNDAMRFTPANFTARRNETIRFVVRNAGNVKHEFALGTEKELKQHYEVMKKNPEMEHADPNMVTVAPGKTGEVVWQFTKAGKVSIGCLQPGHYDAGMKGLITVGKAAASQAGKMTVAQAGKDQSRPGEMKIEKAAENTDMTEGEVRKIDKEQGKITLKHGAIKNLDMPGMTMVFRVKDAAMLDKVQEGDKVGFTADKIGGQFTVTGIEKK